MNNKIKIGILGGDARQSAVCSLLSQRGIECAIWGASSQNSSADKNSVKCVDWRDALCGANAVILPLPLTTDGVRVNCGKVQNGTEQYIPRVTEIIQATDRSTIIFAGKIPVNLARFALEHNVRMIDYYEFEDFQIKNSVPTAEGAISIAISEMDITLSGCNAAVVGYGRIGRTLSQKLIALGANVTCIARSKKDLAWASCDGCVTGKIEQYLEDPGRFDVIFNTVPHIIFDEKTIDKLDSETLFIDLASANGGINMPYATEKGIKVIKALSLPGRVSPFTAGKIIYDTICEVLREEKIL